MSLLQVDTLILQQKAAGCGNREILCQQTSGEQKQMSTWKHVHSCCEARDANGSASYVLGRLRLSDLAGYSSSCHTQLHYLQKIKYINFLFL